MRFVRVALVNDVIFGREHAGKLRFPTSLIPIHFQAVNTGETLLVRSVSPNPFPRTFSIGSSYSFSFGKNYNLNKCQKFFGGV
jgi:hypothetical protein